MENINWQYVGITTEGVPFEINGIDVWSVEWLVSNFKSFEAPHHSYPSQMYTMSPYKISSNGSATNIAVSEVSAGVYVFYKLSSNT